MKHEYVKYEIYECPENPTEYGKYIGSTPILEQAQVVAETGTNIYETEAELLEHYEKNGEMNDTIRRIELQGAPYLSELYGPMYDGEYNGATVIRYESKKVYEMMSD